MVRHRFFPHLIALGLCAAAAVWLTYPAIRHLDTHFIGHPFGDHTEYASLIAHFAAALRAGQSPFVLADYLYPHGLDAALLWAIPLQSFPAWLFAFVLPLPAAFNLTALLFLTLNGWSMFAMARHGVGLATPAALIGAVTFTCAPALQGQIGAAHLGLIALFPAALFALALLRLHSDGRRRWLIAAGISGAASLWGSVLLLVYVTLPIALTITLSAVVRRDWPVVRRLGSAGIVTAVCAAPFLIPFALSLDPATAEIGGTVGYSAPLVGLGAPSFQHPVYGLLDYPRRAYGTDPFERAAYLGVVGLMLMALAVWKVPAARRWLIAAGAAWVLSLGPLLTITDQPVRVGIDGHTTPIALPYAWIAGLPPISLTRTPARFGLFVAFAVSLMTAYGAAIGFRRRGRWTPFIAALLIGLIAVDTRWFWPMPVTSAAIPPGIAALAGREDIRAVFAVPWAHPLTDKDAMYYQTAHGHPLIGGHVARRTPLDPTRAWILQASFDLALLDAAGIDLVIVHRQWADAEGVLEARAAAAFGAPTYADDHVAIFDVPPPTAPAPLIWTARFDGPAGAGDPAGALTIDAYLPGLGYRSLTIPADPPCPVGIDPTLICARVLSALPRVE